MTTIAYSSVNIQTSAQSVPSVPAWFGEVTLIVHHLQRQGMLAAIEQQVRFARRRFGRYEVIDFVSVLFGYAISGERTLESFYEQLQPWADPFMALGCRATVCQHARRSVAFSPHLTRPRSSPCARSF